MNHLLIKKNFFFRSSHQCLPATKISFLVTCCKSLATKLRCLAIKLCYLATKAYCLATKIFYLVTTLTWFLLPHNSLPRTKSYLLTRITTKSLSIEKIFFYISYSCIEIFATTSFELYNYKAIRYLKKFLKNLCLNIFLYNNK